MCSGGLCLCVCRWCLQSKCGANNITSDHSVTQATVEGQTTGSPRLCTEHKELHVEKVLECQTRGRGEQRDASLTAIMFIFFTFCLFIEKKSIAVAF